MSFLSKIVEKYSREPVLKQSVLHNDYINPTPFFYSSRCILHPLTFDEILQTIDFSQFYQESENNRTINFNLDVNNFLASGNNFRNFMKTFMGYNNNYDFWKNEFENIEQLIVERDEEADYFNKISQAGGDGYSELAYDIFTEHDNKISTAKDDFVKHLINEIIYLFFCPKDNSRSPLYMHYTKTIQEKSVRRYYQSDLEFMQVELCIVATFFTKVFHGRGQNFRVFNLKELRKIRPDLFEK